MGNDRNINLFEINKVKYCIDRLAILKQGNWYENIKNLVNLLKSQNADGFYCFYADRNSIHATSIILAVLT